jgi:hypothetical protein
MFPESENRRGQAEGGAERPRRISPEQAAQRFAGRSLPEVDRGARSLDRQEALEHAKANAARILDELRAGGLDDFEEPAAAQPEAVLVEPNEMVKGKTYTLEIDGDEMQAKFVRREGEYQDFVFQDASGQEIVRSAVELMESKAKAA